MRREGRKWAYQCAEDNLKGNMLAISCVGRFIVYRENRLIAPGFLKNEAHTSQFGV